MGSKMPSHHAVAVRLSAARKGNKTTQYWKSLPLSLLGVWIMVAACIAMYICGCLNAVVMERRKEVLVSLCDERARMLQDQFAVSVNHVHALAILVSTFHHHKHPSAIDQETFAVYTARTAFERPLLSGVAYAKRVLHSEREKFEKQQGWTIKTMKREPSSVQDEYAPVIFTQKTVSYLESLDMMSGEEDGENILRARESGKAVLTSPFRLLESNHLGVVLTFPVYYSGLSPDATVDDRIKSTAGYLGGAFDVESLVKNLLRQLSGNQAIVVNVYDVTNSSEPLIMYGSLDSGGDMSLAHVSLLDFGDPFRKHHMSCRYYQKPSIPWSTITTSVGIFVIAVLVGYITYAAVTHIAKVEDAFRKMEELKVRAEDAGVAKSEFLATVSHEIRTPMNGVLGMLSMLLDTNLDSNQKDYAKTAQVCGKALITLINEVLDRAKVESGKIELEEVPFDVRSALDDVLSVFSAKSRGKGIELAVFVSEKVPEIIIGDPGRFRQIITNLVGNSVKFTERGHIFVQVHMAEHRKHVLDVMAEVDSKRGTGVDIISGGSPFTTLSGFEAADNRNCWETFKLLVSEDQYCMATDEASDYVSLTVSVEDTGIGIPLHAQDRVFTPFMQADSSTSRNYGGTGIGLSISKCLVELMSGQISFLSRPLIGSTFTFTAVFKRCEKNAITDLKRPLSEALPSGLKGMRAIVVDKRPLRGAITKYHLQRLGIWAEVVSSIKLAFGSLSQQNGCSKPGVGREIILIEKEIWLSEHVLDWKSNVKSFKLPKLILLATSADSDKAKAAGFDRVIMKPLRASTIAACLQQVLGLKDEKPQGKEAIKNSGVLHTLLFEKNILVVDDNSVNRKVAAGALKKYGARVECVGSGKDALALLKLPHKFDACFMDVQMPEMDGFEATRRIRIMESNANEDLSNGGSAAEGSNEVKYHLPILAMTADVIHATYEKCRECGMDAYVSKPFDEEQLYQAAAKFFESKSIPNS
ncbi:probable histidine kinase 4 [Aristolochia californica]|uniref:probable histidine kinase 4 n=1 Tax=Aristolochia californica TaxID=171875 RepID=UPI0035E16813